MLNDTYCMAQPARAAIDGLAGPALLEFGAGWCGHCRATEAPLAAALAQYPGVAHIRVEDGPGRALGRSFRVKLWPTLIFLKDGREVARLVRPLDSADISRAFALIAA
ncbi:thioredoxin [Janthinobacterium sp. BJB1]|uniref:thioredoxin family protein n=1 Tax=Janthinobacterium sp. GW458P TaxID=1981504 RepID=UPI000A322962|nr:thioredoxin family protein [Janthinobacterium sp. GW458P]MBE3023722.1 thioredoxin family protein [Janthinobacterium sp. GW458P]PHV18623.1 thioredoxin [Janthinobacterium sp. BJB303]PJC99436.1 thioredoxin [Janthinobacterium sp. BJB1]